MEKWLSSRNEMCPGDTSWGPAISGCRHEFDFTLLFEEGILAIVPAVLFILLAALDIMTLLQKIPPESLGEPSRPWLKSGKLVGYVGLSATNLALFIAVLQAQTPLDSTIGRVRLVAAVMSLLAACVMGCFSYYHEKHLQAVRRPSILLNSFLLVFLAVAVVRSRTVWLVFGRQAYTFLFTTSTTLTAVLAILEAIPHRKRTAWDTVSPEETSGLYSLAFLTWLNPLVRLGYRKILDSDDLYPLDSRLSSDTVSRQFQKSWQQKDNKKKKKKKSLLLIVLRSSIWSFLLPIPSRLAMIIFMFCQPFFIHALVTHLQSDPSESHESTGKALILSSIIIYLGIALSAASYHYLKNRALARTRAALVTAIFEHALTLPSSDLEPSILTLMSTDIDRIMNGLEPLHDLWANLLEAALAIALLGLRIALAPLLLIVLCTAAALVVSTIASPRMGRWTALTASRVALTNAVVAATKPLQLAGLAPAVAGRLRDSRARELSAGNAFRWVVVVIIMLAFIPQFGGPAAMFAAAAWGQQEKMDMGEVFARVSILALLTFPLSQLLQKGGPILAAWTSLGRVQDYLEKEQRREYRLFEETDDGDVAASLENVSVGWDEDKWQLTDLSLRIPKSQLTIVTGPVAAGKTTLCKLLLGEAARVEGTITLQRKASSGLRIAYCDQTAFLVSGSIQSNIVGLRQFDASLYDQVLEAALLKPDLRTLPLGDRSDVGSGGIMLSGGQRQRVALARALYLEADLYVLDDFTAGLDSETAGEIVRRLFEPADGYLRRRRATVVWCTHSARFFALAQYMVAFGREGRVRRKGTLEEVLQDQQVTLSLEKDADDKNNQEGQAETSTDQDVGAALPTVPNAASINKPTDTSASRALNGPEVYIYYFSSFGTPLLVTCALLALAEGFFANSITVWLKFWADNSFSIPGSPAHVNTFYLSTLAVLSLLTILILGLYVATINIAMATISGTTLHTRAVHALLAAPLSFITQTDQGALVNLFSQDMNLLDTVLPLMLLNALALFVISLGQAVVIALATPAIALSYPVLIVGLAFVTRYYLRTSRQLRLLELEEKSPLYTQFADAVRGIATLRVLEGWREAWRVQNEELCDASQRPLYLLSALSLWLSLILRLVVAGLAVMATTLAAARPAGGSSAGFVGAAFVALMDLGGLATAVISCWVELEMSLGAVKRLKEFGESAGRQEEEEKRSGQEIRPGEAWPESGEIILDAVDASYSEQKYKDVEEETALALRDVSMHIKPGEKVAIVGRTGSGKSSLLLLLLRLLDPTPQTASRITIDGLPLHRIHRESVRRRIIAMPQDMVFVAAGESFKEALDPYSQATDNECQAALEAVGLVDRVYEAGGLHAEMGKDSLSLGQKQLFSLAITVLRAQMRERQCGLKGGVLLLDEVTSNVDRETEAKIMEVIGEVFRGYTVVAVTHSLESVLGFNRVFVMANGRVVKEGRLDELLQDGETVD